MSTATPVMLDPCTIGPAASDDGEALAALHATCFDDPWQADLIARVLGSPIGFGVVARQGNQVRGFVLCRVAVGEGEVLTLCVAEAVRRRGLGHALLKAAVEVATGRGLTSLFLEVAESNEAARALYGRFGFDQVGRRSAYYRDAAGTTVDALTLRYQQSQTN